MPRSGRSGPTACRGGWPRTWNPARWTSRRSRPASGVGDTERVPATDDPSGDLPVTGSLVVPGAALSWRFSRSSGPGGQGVNTADSRVELSMAPLELPALTDPQRARLAARLG